MQHGRAEGGQAVRAAGWSSVRGQEPAGAGVADHGMEH